MRIEDQRRQRIKDGFFTSDLNFPLTNLEICKNMRYNY